MNPMSAERIIATALLVASSCVFVFGCKGKHSNPPPSESSLNRRQRETSDPTEELAGGSRDAKGGQREPQHVMKPTDDLADDRHQEDDVPKRPAQQPKRPAPPHEEEE